MASASSSSDSVPNAPRKYDVFISFRGEETRNNFTSHLYAALKRASLDVFRDDDGEKFERGDEIAPSLIQAIKDSSVSVIVFSNDYASSKWCLDELEQIMQYRKAEGQYVIPIFYKVDPSDVRKQTGAYKKAFKKHKKDYKHDSDRVNKWRAALVEVGNLGGRHCEPSTDESEFIQQIVTDVSTKLKHIYNRQGTSKDVIGIDEMIEPIVELLTKSHKVGIWGMGGAGKTTMAKTLFHKLSSQYDSCCFLEKVREETDKKGVKHVRDSLVLELLGQDMQNKLSDGTFVATKLRTRKAFVVLDDVDSTEQLKNLLDKTCNYLGEGSKVIITIRDQKLLRGKGYEIHEAKGLSYENSRRLFIRKAFGSDNPEDGYEELIKGFVDYTKHNPLALEVLGLYVHSEDKKLWGDLLRKLRAGNPHKEIQKVLSLSYDRLDRYEKQIFLDIACFLKGESKEFVKELMESYGFYPVVGMQKLEDNALIDTTSGRVEMHDLIQEMGHQIVREESMQKLEGMSRLWDPREISDALKTYKKEKAVEGIMLTTYNKEDLELTAKSFNKMEKLRFLKVYNPFPFRHMHGFKSIPKRLNSISTQIKYFRWDCYPMKSLPSNFCAEHLLELSLISGEIETLWEGVQDLAYLRRLDLGRCKNLKELPDFSKACRLESVDLNRCESLCDVHESSLLSLHSLIYLDVSFCRSLKSLKSGIHLKSLKEIKACSCDNLKEFSVSSEELTFLNLSGTKIAELNPSIKRCSKLSTLYLRRTKLKNLPIKVLRCLKFLEVLHISHMEIDIAHLRVLFDHLHSLQSLGLKKCRKLTGLPHNITRVSSLQKICLESCPDLTELPYNMKLLSKLQCLYVVRCTALQSLPELPPSLRELNATDCTSLETLTTSTISSTPHNKGAKVFSFTSCKNLDLDAIEEQVKLVLTKAVHEKEDVAVCYPGNKVPEWFGNNRTQNSDTLNHCLCSHTLVGFVFCALAPHFLAEELFWGDLDIAFRINEMTEGVAVHFPGSIGCRSGNVLLRSYPKAPESIQEKIRGIKGNHEEATDHNPNLSITLGLRHQSILHALEECGVYPIYASGNTELNSNSRKRKAVMI